MEGEGTWSRRRRRRWPWAVVIVALLAAGGAGGWLLYHRSTRSTAAACLRGPAPSPVARPPAPAQVQVHVLNGTRRAGLAGRTGQDLTGRGFMVVSVGNVPPGAPPPQGAIVRYGPTGAEAAKVIATQVVNPQLVADARPDPTVDLVLGIGFDKLRTPQEAAAGPPPPAAGPPVAAGAPSPRPSPTASCRSS